MSGEKNNLEKNLMEIEITKQELEEAIRFIDSYHENNMYGESDVRKYKKYLDKRDNLSVMLNYYQNQVIIELQDEIINKLVRNTK